MMMYRFAMFFALLSGFAGMIGWVMDYNVAHDGVNWFPGANVHPIDNSTMFSDQQIKSMQTQSTVTSSDTTSQGSYDFSVFSLVSLCWSIGSGVLLIEPQMEKVFTVFDNKNDPTHTKNLFSGFLWAFQLGIWCIYAVGITQIWRNQNYRYNL